MAESNEVEPGDTIDERVVKAIGYFKSEAEIISSGDIDSLTIKEIRSLRDETVYDAINFYLEDCTTEQHDVEELGRLVFRLQGKLESEYLGVVL